MSLAQATVLNLIPDCIPDDDQDLLVDLVLLQPGVVHAADVLRRARPPRMVHLEHSSFLHLGSVAGLLAAYTNVPSITEVPVAHETMLLVEAYCVRTVHLLG